MGAQSYLLIGIETHTNLAVLDFRMFQQVDHSLHDLGNAGLIVRSEQRVSVGDNDVLAFMGKKFGKFRRRSDDTGPGVKHDVAAVIAAHYTGLHIAAGTVGTGIHVCDETDHRHRLVGVGGKRSIEVAVGIEFHLSESDCLQFFFQIAGQIELLVRAGSFPRLVGRLCVKADIL